MRNFPAVKFRNLIAQLESRRKGAEPRYAYRARRVAKTCNLIPLHTPSHAGEHRAKKRVTCARRIDLLDAKGRHEKRGFVRDDRTSLVAVRDDDGLGAVAPANDFADLQDVAGAASEFTRRTFRRLQTQCDPHPPPELRPSPPRGPTFTCK